MRLFQLQFRVWIYNVSYTILSLLFSSCVAKFEGILGQMPYIWSYCFGLCPSFKKKENRQRRRTFSDMKYLKSLNWKNAQIQIQKKKNIYIYSAIPGKSSAAQGLCWFPCSEPLTRSLKQPWSVQQRSWEELEREPWASAPVRTNTMMHELQRHYGTKKWLLPLFTHFNISPNPYAGIIFLWTQKDTYTSQRSLVVNHISTSEKDPKITKKQNHLDTLTSHTQKLVN